MNTTTPNDDGGRALLIEKLTEAAMASGKLIEIGWLSYRRMCVPPGASEAQLRETRWAFFAGAQHLWGSIMHGLQPGQEPTDEDERRMTLIDKELSDFFEQLKAHVKARFSQ